MSSEGFSNRGNVDRWHTGPPGFVRKANHQLDELDARTLRTPVKPEGVEGVGRMAASGPRVFPAVIVGSSSARTESINVAGEGAETVTVEWDYDFEEVRYLSDGSVEVVTGGRTGTAKNQAELGNGSRYVFDIDMEHADYPVGHRPVPIGGGGSSITHKADKVVWLQPVRAGETTLYIFDRQGVHDGPCED